MKLADPRPSLCTACCNSGEAHTRFVDTGAFREGPVVLDKSTGEMAVDYRGMVIQMDDIYLCDACVREAAEIIGYKPELHRKQLGEIRRLDNGMRYWRETAKRQEQEIARLVGAPDEAGVNKRPARKLQVVS